MRPLREPFASIVAGRPAEVALSGATLLGARLLTKELAFPADERDAFGLRGLLPDRVLSIEEQVALEIEHLRRKSDDLERYIGLAALQDRNATLFYRLLADHLEELMPVVYTPTVGLVCQQYSHILRRTRGIWITPHDIGRIPETLRTAPYEDVRLIVVTDNERILGLGDLGAGGMAIPIGKLALYSATSGIHPSSTLPVSLDVGTDSVDLLGDPLYVGYRAPRLRGSAYDELVEAFVEGVAKVWPGCLIQWEDFKGANALRILDRFADRAPSFNDDVQGTAAVTLAGLYAGARVIGRGLAELRFVLAGAGAAGVGIVRLLRLALEEEGVAADAMAASILVLDSHGLVHSGRNDLDTYKREVACPTAVLGHYGLAEAGSRPPGLAEVIGAVRPHVLVGTTGQPGSFGEPVIRAMAAGTPRPVVLCLSNPSSRVEAAPADVMRWSRGRALVATGSPFPPFSQANNVFVFPGLGLGAMTSQARAVTQAMFLAAARTLAAGAADGRSTQGALFPPVQELASISRAIAVAVASEAVRAGLAEIPASTDLGAIVDEAMWRPTYVPYRRLATAGSESLSP